MEKDYFGKVIDELQDALEEEQRTRSVYDAEVWFQKLDEAEKYLNVSADTKEDGKPTYSTEKARDCAVQIAIKNDSESFKRMCSKGKAELDYSRAKGMLECVRWRLRWMCRREVTDGTFEER